MYRDSRASKSCYRSPAPAPAKVEIKQPGQAVSSPPLTPPLLQKQSSPLTFPTSLPQNRSGKDVPEWYITMITAAALRGERKSTRLWASDMLGVINGKSNGDNVDTGKIVFPRETVVTGIKTS
jgi:hypothetical protein